jgi:hypothetical protein
LAGKRLLYQQPQEIRCAAVKALVDSLLADCPRLLLPIFDSCFVEGKVALFRNAEQQDLKELDGCYLAAGTLAESAFGGFFQQVLIGKKGVEPFCDER